MLDAIPPGCTRAVDVGCGNGELTRELRRRGIREVVGIDRNVPCVERARAHPEADGIGYIVGDVRDGGLAPASFGLVSAVSSLHHMDARVGLSRLRELVAPGGVLVVIGLARPDLPRDIPRELVAAVVIRAKRLRPRERPAFPMVWPPPERYATMRRVAAELLPGVRWRRHLLGRYSPVWTNPG